MNKQFSILLTFIDNDNYYYLLDLDTIKNTVSIHPLKDNNTKSDYHLELKSSALVKVVDELNGIEINNIKYDGKGSLELLRQGKIDEIFDGLSHSLTKKSNLIITIPKILSELSDTYKTDIPITDALKTFISEINQLNDWKIFIEN